MSALPPQTHRVSANGLTHRVLEWAPRRPTTEPARATRTVVLVHGFLDAAGTWDRVAPRLAAEGLRVLAPDMRGFGDGARAPAGSYYHFADYVADLADLVERLAPDEPLALVGHSMGGAIVTLFAGAFPEKVVRLVNLEGLGPDDTPFEAGPARMRRWIEQTRRVHAQGSPAPLLRAEAHRRLAARHPDVPAEVLEHALAHLARDADVRDPEGRPSVTWRFDPIHRTTSPTPFFAKLFVEFARRVACPVLFVSGGATGFHPEGEDERLTAFADLQRHTLEGAGHMLHWTRPEELATTLLAFL